MEHPITSTLFRFVNYRNAELQTEAQLIPSTPRPTPGSIGGVFEDAILNMPPGKSKIQVLRKAAKDFANPLKSVSDVKTIDQAMYNFSTWLVRNKTTYTDAELAVKMATVTQQLSAANLKIIWNNLFYQFITQESFYVKEALMQMILADHAFRLINKDYANNIDYNRTVVNAKVALPGELFANYNKIPPKADGANAVKKFIPTGALKKQFNVVAAKATKKNMAMLRKEIEKSEKTYRKQFANAHKTAYALHEQAIKPILEQYSADIETARQAYCASHNTTIPYDPGDPCMKPGYVPYPSLPSFEFSFETEISKNKIQQELKPDSYKMLLGVLGYDFTNGTPDDIDGVFEDFATYGSIYNAIDTSSADAGKEIVANASTARNSFTIEGTTVPYSDKGRDPHHSYRICGIRLSSSKMTYYITYTVPNQSWQILSLKITVTYPDDSTETEIISQPNVSINENNNLLTLTGFYQFDIPDNQADDHPSINFELTFSNGTKRLIPGVDSLMDYCVTDVSTDSDPAPAPDPDDVPAVPNGPFVPKGFGITQLGVADYLRVEQTVQCYVEGEVSHIENVMAREYRERATRSLRRSEDTTTTSSEEEREKLRDSTTTDRYELHSEISRVIAQSKDLAGSVNASYNGTDPIGNHFSVTTALSYATNNSSEDNSVQAQTKAQEITERAMDRVVSKIKEERISKIVEEYEENNKHGFDNRQGAQHVVGVYRWVDKLYKNQIWNYGKRMMFEFMIPEPSTLHILGMKEKQEINTGNYPLEPLNPKTYVDEYLKLDQYTAINAYNEEEIVSFWAGQFNVETEPRPAADIYIGKSFSGSSTTEEGRIEYFSFNDEVSIPEGYIAEKSNTTINANDDGDTKEGKGVLVSVGNSKFLNLSNEPLVNVVAGTEQDLYPFTGTIPVAATFANYFSGSVAVSIKCKLTDEALNQWKINTFNAIINAYEEALAEYNKQIAAFAAVTAQVKATNPGYYRQIENIVLRKNCLSYIIDQNTDADFTYGKDLTNGSDTFSTFEVKLNEGIDKYASTIKFLEQAFEWDIMSYFFYPFYWGRKSNWAGLYQFDGSDDPLFRSFMQAGMARVVVTVRPGFEAAVALYMTTGEIWNGNEDPTVVDELYYPVIKEITAAKDMAPNKSGKAWITRLPTSLTILQADSIGLKVDKALPCNCGEADEFEPGILIPCDSNFEITGAQLGQEQTTGQGKKLQFIFQHMEKHTESEGAYSIGFNDANGLFPKIFECMGQSIAIDRDAS